MHRDASSKNNTRTKGNTKSMPVDRCFETDHEVRDCQILLYTSHVEYSFLSHLLMGRGLHRQRWSLVAYFERGNRSYTFHAVVGENGKIEARRIRGAWPAEPSEAIFIGVVKTSPKRLLSLAQEHPYNGTNSPIFASFQKCQDWLNCFAQTISPTLHLP